MAELSQAELERLVNGTPPDPRVLFYDQAELDHEASVAAGRRVYNKALYIKVTAPGVTDWVAYRAQREDVAKYPTEYARYKSNQQGHRPASVDIIPGLDILHLQELQDMALSTIPALAAAQWVPDHLEYAREAARAIINVLRRTANEQGKGSEQSQGEIEVSQNRRGPDRGHWADGLAAGRQIHTNGTGGPEFPDCDGIDGGDCTGGDDEGGCVDLRGGQSAGDGTGTGPRPRSVSRPGNAIDNWKLEFHWG